VLFCVKWFGFLFFGNKITPDGLFSFCDRPSFRCTVCFRFATYCLSALQLVFVLRHTVCPPYSLFLSCDRLSCGRFSCFLAEMTFTYPFFVFPGCNRLLRVRFSRFLAKTDHPAAGQRVLILRQTVLHPFFTFSGCNRLSFGNLLEKKKACKQNACRL